MSRRAPALFERALLWPALRDALLKLDPRVQWRNPVMFVVYIGSALTTLLWLQALAGSGEAPAWFIFNVTLWLWFTVLFANFAESLAEGRSKAQAAALRGLKQTVWAKKLADVAQLQQQQRTRADELRRGDLVLIEAGDYVPADGEVLRGAASVDESAITGESAPVIREAGGDFSAVTGGTRVLSDWLVVRVTVNPGETFLDRMIAMVESARRQKTPNEIALTILLVALTLVFLLATATLLPYSLYSVAVAAAGAPITITALVALLVCLIPTTIGALLSAIGVAGMSRMLQANVIATSGRAVEAAGDVDVLLLDKTGTITLGNRQAAAFMPAAGVSEEQLADVAQLASLADETPEGRSIVVLAKQRFGLRERELTALGAVFVPFSAHTRMSGVDIGTRHVRKGAADAIQHYVEALGQMFPRALLHERAGGGTARQYAAGGVRRGTGARHHRAQGHRQGRHPGALRRAAPHGHQDGHDHRRQSADGRGHRSRSRRGRLPRRGHPGGETATHPRAPGAGAPGRHDRRWHQRCPGAGAGGRRGRHEHRHAGGQGGRQHGGSGFQPHQAHRGGGDRQTDAHDARRP